MSLALTQTLSKDTPADVDTNTVVYSCQAQDLGMSVFSVSGLTLPNQKLLTVSHDVGKNGEQRHLVKLDRTEVDTLLVPATVSVKFNIVRPVSTAITNAIILEEIYRLIDFLIEGGAGANITAILNGET